MASLALHISEQHGWATSKIEMHLNKLHSSDLKNNKTMLLYLLVILNLLEEMDHQKAI
jgi:hypothetical protein